MDKAATPLHQHPKPAAEKDIIMKHPPPSGKELENHNVGDASKQPAQEESTQDATSRLSDLLACIHQDATQTWKQQCLEKAPASKKEEELLFLQQKRMRLAAVVEAHRAKKSKREETTTGNLLSASVLSRRPYLCGWGGLATLETAKQQEALLQQAQHCQEQVLREKHTLQAANRVAGISLYWINQPANDENENPILALHFDLLVHGRFVASYHCFWDVVHVEEYSENEEEEDSAEQRSSSRTQPSDDSLHLRLVQHTLPAAIPLTRILHETVATEGNPFSPSGGGLLPLADKGFDAVKQGLGPLARRLYQACYCYMVRKLAHQELHKRQKDTFSCTIKEIEVNEAMDRISFDLSVPIHTETMLRVHIVYGDKERPQPTSVRVQRVVALQPHRRRRRGRPGEVSDNDSDDTVDDDGGMQDDMTDKATTAFRQLPMSEALDQVFLDLQREEAEDATMTGALNGVS